MASPAAEFRSGRGRTQKGKIQMASKSKELVTLSEEQEKALAYFENVGREQSTGGFIIGKLLKFDKRGNWTAGRDDEEDIAVGTKMTFAYDQMLKGSQCWINKKLVDTDLGLVIQGFMPKRREELSMWPDKSEWPRDKDDVPTDPWQSVNILVLKDLDDQFFTYVASSKGGLSAVGQLMVATSQHVRAYGYGEYPVIALGSTHYKHPEYGKIFKPTLEITGWVPKEDFGSPIAGDESERPAKPAPKKQLAPPKASNSERPHGVKPVPASKPKNGKRSDLNY
jgi:hypothetical protein